MVVLRIECELLVNVAWRSRPESGGALFLVRGPAQCGPVPMSPRLRSRAALACSVLVPTARAQVVAHLDGDGLRISRKNSRVVSAKVLWPGPCSGCRRQDDGTLGGASWTPHDLYRTAVARLVPTLRTTFRCLCLRPALTGPGVGKSAKSPTQPFHRVNAVPYVGQRMRKVVQRCIRHRQCASTTNG